MNSTSTSDTQAQLRWEKQAKFNLLTVSFNNFRTLDPTSFFFIFKMIKRERKYSLP